MERSFGRSSREILPCRFQCVVTVCVCVLHSNGNINVVSTWCGLLDYQVLVIKFHVILHRTEKELHKKEEKICSEL